MERYKLFTTRFFNFYGQLSPVVIDEIVLQIKNVLAHDTKIDELKDSLVRSKNFAGCVKLWAIEIMILKSIRVHVLNTYGITLQVGGNFENRDLYKDAPVLSLKEIDERFSNIDAQNFATTLLLTG